MKAAKAASPSKPERWFSENQIPQYWQEIMDETDFATYLAYLEAHTRTQPFLLPLCETIRTRRASVPKGTSLLSILELSCSAGSDISIGPWILSDSLRELLETLRWPSKGIDVQVVLWHPLTVLDEPVMDALGLGLRIDPRFFDTLFSIQLLSRGHKKLSENTRPLYPNTTVLGRDVATIVRCSASSKRRGVPVVVIALTSISYITNVKKLDEHERGFIPAFSSSAIRELTELQ